MLLTGNNYLNINRTKTDTGRFVQKHKLLREPRLRNSAKYLRNFGRSMT